MDDQIERAHERLDALGIPREDEHGSYTLAGRIDELAEGINRIKLDDEQAAQMFRSNTPSGCQFEGGRMRWWMGGIFRLELNEGRRWVLYVVPTRTYGPDMKTAEEVFDLG